MKRASLEKDADQCIRLLRETLASEHCGYSHTRTHIRKLMSRMPELHVDPCGNSGWVDFDGTYGLSFKIESHNHPTAVAPFEGAATGVGGIIRDVLASGARPVALADGLMFGGPHSENMNIVAGIAHYANTCGIPTIAGETRRSRAFRGTPLVNVMCVGIARRSGFDRPLRPPRPGDALVLVGAPTARDGLGGAVFASRELATRQVADGRRNDDHIQHPDAFAGHMLIRLMNSLDKRDIAARDLGAGGLGVAAYEFFHPAGETSPAACGVEIDLSLVPGADSMTPVEVLLSESQERMLIATSRPGVVVDSAKEFGLSAAIIGSVTWRDFVVRIGDQESFKVEEVRVRNASISHDGLGRRFRSDDEAVNFREVYSQFDWSVGGRTVIGPGADRAGVIHPRETGDAIAIALTSNRLYEGVSVSESIRRAYLRAKAKVEAVGGVPLGATNGINVGDPETPEVANEIEEIFRGLEQAFEETGIPIVSGNVSCYNTVAFDSTRQPIPPTVYIGMVGRCARR